MCEISFFEDGLFHMYGIYYARKVLFIDVNKGERDSTRRKEDNFKETIVRFFLKTLCLSVFK